MIIGKLLYLPATPRLPIARAPGGFFLCESWMIVSRCCKDKVAVELDYFICDKCGKPCRTIFSLQLSTDKDDEHDASPSNVI